MATPTILIVPDRFKSGVLYSQLPESGAVDFDVTRATTAFRTNASGILESVASGVPRLDYPAAGGCPSLLVEPAATNLFRASEPAVDPGQGVRTNITFEANTWGVGLDGSVVFEDNAVNRIYQNTASLSGAHTLFFLAKRTDNGVVSDADIRGMFNNSGASTTFTLWKDNIYIGRAFATSVSGASNGVFKDTGRTANRVEVSAIMIVAGDVQLSPSSYIKTTGAAATRNADVISKTGVSGFIGQAEGTLYAEVDIANPDKSIIRTILGIGDGTVANRFSIRRDTNGRIIVICVVGSSTLGFVQTGNDQLGVFKIAVAYAVNDLTMYVNGASIGTTAIASVPACSRIDVGKLEGTGTTNQLNDRIRAAAIYPTRLSNDELTALTTL
jgi:hypothetical protein